MADSGPPHAHKGPGECWFRYLDGEVVRPCGRPAADHPPSAEPMGLHGLRPPAGLLFTAQPRSRLGPLGVLHHPRPLCFILLVPCLNEARVIGPTLESLCALRGRHHVAVLDDASDDGTPDVVGRFPPWMVTLVERRGADSRVGKGAALNQGYRELLRWRVDDLYGPENVIVVVFDADARVPTDFLERMTPYFSDPAVVGVQSAVRMYNADRSRLTFWQNLEFVVWARVFSRAKDLIGSATLGGNGQCVRLSALIPLGDAPWRPSLTEDLDLSLRLILDGGRIRFCGDVYVAQEAVLRVSQLIRQRARWIHGHLVTWQHLPAIVRSAAPLRVRLDLVAFLLLPAALVPLALASIAGWWVLVSSLGALSLEVLLVWYVLAFLSVPLTVWALIRGGEVHRGKAIVQAHLYVVYSMLWMVAAWDAVWSIIRGDDAWAKTSRVRDVAIQPSSAIEPFGTSNQRVGPPGKRVHRGREPGLRVVGAVAAIALVATSTLVLIAAAYLAATTYAEVVSASAQGSSYEVLPLDRGLGNPAPDWAR